MNIIDVVAAHTIETGDQIIIDGDPIEVRDIQHTNDLDEIVFIGYSHESGDVETYPVFADEQVEVWAV